VYASSIGYVHSEEGEAASNPLSSSSKEDHLRRGRREQRQLAISDDFRVEISEFEGKLDLDEFL